MCNVHQIWGNTVFFPFSVKNINSVCSVQAKSLCYIMPLNASVVCLHVLIKSTVARKSM